ncbi:unnamed protein product [Toxocara canis]|uniref:Zinc finger, CCHC-type n=1 Tax=Toxocara canis TaxID=6265 RepID=A0A183U2Z7_TOXCA|nr:unnamed protein product [Toxocara canis]
MMFARRIPDGGDLDAPFGKDISCIKQLTTNNEKEAQAQYAISSMQLWEKNVEQMGHTQHQDVEEGRGGEGGKGEGNERPQEEDRWTE